MKALITKYILILSALIFPIAAIAQDSTSIYEETMSRLGNLQKSEYVKKLPSKLSFGGRKLISFAISDFKSPNSSKTRILICAGQHGDESNPILSVVSLSEKLVSGTHPGILKNAIVIVAPVINPDGFYKGIRENNQGIDINRDWHLLQTPEARYVNSLINTWKPQLTIDAHEWLNKQMLPENGIEVAQGLSGNQRNEMLKLAQRISANSGLAIIPCSEISSKTLFHRHYSEEGFATFLIETAYQDTYYNKDKAYCTALLTAINYMINTSQSRMVLSPASRKLNYSQFTFMQPTAKRHTDIGGVHNGVKLMIVMSIFGYFLLFRLRKQQMAARNYEYKIRCYHPTPRPKDDKPQAPGRVLAKTPIGTLSSLDMMETLESLPKTERLSPFSKKHSKHLTSVS
jgi:hypothetical protein